MRTDLNNYWESQWFPMVGGLYAESRFPNDENSYARVVECVADFKEWAVGINISTYCCSRSPDGNVRAIIRAAIGDPIVKRRAQFFAWYKSRPSAIEIGMEKMYCVTTAASIFRRKCLPEEAIRRVFVNATTRAYRRAPGAAPIIAACHPPVCLYFSQRPGFLHTCPNMRRRLNYTKNSTASSIKQQLLTTIIYTTAAISALNLTEPSQA